MSRRRKVENDGEVKSAPSVEEKKGMRAHDDFGNVRPADGRWDLHEPSEESKYVKDSETPVETEVPVEDVEEN
jgi:hypothetical protein